MRVTEAPSVDPNIEFIRQRELCSSTEMHLRLRPTDLAPLQETWLEHFIREKQADCL